MKRSEMNAICRPSWDHTGYPFLPGLSVSCVMLDPSALITYISSSLGIEGAEAVKASLSPSGDHEAEKVVE